MEEQNEGRKDAQNDRADKKKKAWNLNTHTQPYVDGYNEVWAETEPKPTIPQKKKDVE